MNLVVFTRVARGLESAPSSTDACDIKYFTLSDCPAQPFVTCKMHFQAGQVVKNKKGVALFMLITVPT